VTTYLDRRFRGVGRIKRAAGTEHKPTIRLLNAMLTGLFERGRLDILKSIHKGDLTPLQVWEYYRINELEKLPTAQTMGQLEAKMSAWINDKECSEAYRLTLRQTLRDLLSVSPRTPTVADLPDLLEAWRKKRQADKKAVSFNRAKAHVQSFIRSTLKKSHPLYHAVTGVEVLKVSEKRGRHPLTVDEFLAVYRTMCLSSSKAARIAWVMVNTGMGWSEYQGRWNLAPDRVAIFGTKRKGRNRAVPRIVSFVGMGQREPLSYKVFRAELAKASGGTVTPYDFRRTYANWLEAAGVPRTRRKMYLGHGASDVTDLYERHEVERFLAEDAERLRRFVGATDKSEEVPRLKLEKA
jgi:integrase